MPHFIIKSENIKRKVINISDKDLYKHIIKVMRSKPGEKILFLDENKIQYETILKNIESDYFTCNIISRYKSNRTLNINLYAAQSVLNSDAQISAVQKATELGVKGIFPLCTDNCSVKKSVIESKIDKWQKIAFESVKQCERADIPKVYNLTNLEELTDKFEQIIVFAESDTDRNFFEYLKENPIDKTKDILITIL